jgi:hypothetical protein
MQLVRASEMCGRGAAPVAQKAYKKVYKYKPYTKSNLSFFLSNCGAATHLQSRVRVEPEVKARVCYDAAVHHGARQHVAPAARNRMATLHVSATTCLPSRALRAGPGARARPGMALRGSCGCTRLYASSAHFESAAPVFPGSFGSSRVLCSFCTTKKVSRGR